MTVKDELRRIVDEMPDDMPASELIAAKRFLEYLRERWSDPVIRVLEEAPYEDEAIPDTEENAVQEAREALVRGEVVSDEDLRRELDL